MPTDKISIIVPVFNRPQEMEELLSSLDAQTNKDFEVIVVEDGSTLKCEEICETYKAKLDLKYFFKNNTGPALTRNYGYEKAKGNYCIFLDSDCILPANYFDTIANTLRERKIDAFGGPDRAHVTFSNLQKAINYSMTSFFTTGGIRGSAKLDKFYPRSFNMGFSRKVFNATKGFADMKLGEDIDMSIRIMEQGFTTDLVKDAFVYHKRRTSFKLFLKQVFRFGVARIIISEKHPETLRLVHMAPTVFTLGILIFLLLSILLSPLFILPVLIYFSILFIDSTIKNKSLLIGFMSILASGIQLFGYGSGFLIAAINKNFYR